MKPIRAKEGAQLVAVIAAAAIASVAIDALPYWQLPLKLALLFVVIIAVYRIGK